MGGDLSDLQLESCRKDPGLAAITFAKLDLRALPSEARYDFVTANAIRYGFDDAGFRDCISSISGALKTGGTWLHLTSFTRGIRKSPSSREPRHFPMAIPSHFRSFRTSRKLLQSNGFGTIEFRKFLIPVDLPMQDLGAAAIQTHTVTTTSGERLQFRGALAQPWCHLVATKG